MAFNAFDLLEGVPEFDGRTEDLEMFTKHVEEIRKFVDASLLVLFDLRNNNRFISNNDNNFRQGNNNPINFSNQYRTFNCNDNFQSSRQAQNNAGNFQNHGISHNFNDNNNNNINSGNNPVNFDTVRSQQSSVNSSNRMDVSNIQASNFQLQAEELYPV
ncbi:putative uncharacterized protein DDB_G0283431 [Calliphora vicina]|uniref:putative uncharacterized protein DDB_G0283431 n=1 Tax=Calliphora vicina TaxID=7373 RepID=UPI00325AF3BC